METERGGERHERRQEREEREESERMSTVNRARMLIRREMQVGE